MRVLKAFPLHDLIFKFAMLVCVCVPSAVVAEHAVLPAQLHYMPIMLSSC
jgi:hypothetical protein